MFTTKALTIKSIAYNSNIFFNSSIEHILKEDALEYVNKSSDRDFAKSFYG
jgi:hypothetical protein